MRTPRPIAILLLLLLTALPAVAGEGRWTPLGPPRVGPFLDLVVDPAHPSTLYAVSFGEFASGLWKSVDSGERWFSINAGIPNSYTWSLDVDPFAAETLYALGSAASLQVLYRSTDGGGSWTRVHERSSGDEPFFEELAPDPFVKGRLYARQETRVWRSEDGGVTWDIAGKAGDPGGAIRLLADPGTAGTLYMTVGPELWRSLDSGESWLVLHGFDIDDELELVGASSPAGTVFGVLQSVGGPGSVAVCVRFERDGKDATILTLSDFSESCVDLVVNPGDARILYVLSDRGKLYITTDAGLTWASIEGGAPAPGIDHPLRVDFATGTLYLVGERGIFKSTDGGETWKTANRGFTTAALSILLSTPGKKSAVFAAPRGEPLLRTRNGGRTWSDTGIGPVTALSYDPSAPTRLLAAPAQEPGTFPKVFESRNHGGTWSPLGTLPIHDAITRIAVSPVQSKVIYAGTRYSGIFKSVNGGTTWRRASRGLPFLPPCDQTFCPEEPVSALEIDPRDPRIVYAVFGYQVVKSVNAGKTWDLVMDGLDDVSYVEALILDPDSPNAVYIGTREGVFKSTDGGATWRESSIGLPEPVAGGDFAVLDLAIDVRGGQKVLYAATRMDGVFRSTDRGATWEPVNEGLPILLVELVEIDGRRPGGVLAGTAGAGVWAARFD